jgi:hypothetical protein
MSRANLAQTVAAIAEPRRHRVPATPEPPVQSDAWWRSPRLHGRHQTSSPPPLKAARAASPSLASRGLFPPWYVCKMSPPCLLDRVGSNLVEFHAL